MKKSRDWGSYYKKTSSRPVSPLLELSLENIDKLGVAYDLGAGNGVETNFLLSKDWKVIAVDKDINSIKIINKLKKHREFDLTTVHKSFEDLEFESSNLIFARYSLPFCRPEKFNSFWNNIKISLNKNGVFGGVLFGEEDSWAIKEDMSFHSYDDIIRLFAGYEVLFFDEMNKKGKTALGNVKNWHVFSFVLKKR